MGTIGLTLHGQYWSAPPAFSRPKVRILLILGAIICLPDCNPEGIIYRNLNTEMKSTWNLEMYSS